MDDEREITLSDGRKVAAARLEEVLRKHLDSVAYVMVIGSGKPFLSCMLTLKTNGSEAAERGQDPKSVPNPFELAEPALALARKVNSQATNVHLARQCQLFRSHGLLPGFSTANQEIGDSAQQVHFPPSTTLPPRTSAPCPVLLSAAHRGTDSWVCVQVRRFSILTAHFTKETGELNADGSLNRLKIKRAHKNIIEGMYQQKKPAPPQNPAN
jgi:long-subunit acyl-CoA synthetase (AMP-forming)